MPPRLASFAAAIACIVMASGAMPSASLAQGQPATSAAPTRLDDIVTRHKLRVGTTGDYPPFTFLNKDTQTFEGHDIDVARALGRAMGVDVEFVPTTWPTLAKDFSADKFDIAAGGVSITLARQLTGYFSIPIMREGKAPIARCAET